MDDDYRELANRLFAAATDLIETAHGLAIAGQSCIPTAADHAATACRLQAAAREVAIIAEAAMIVANLGINQRRNRRKRPR
jgi:hypothetical protein